MRALGLVLALALAAAGCATKPYHGPRTAPADATKPGAVLASLALDPALEERILALNPEQISEEDLRHTLAAAPAPQIVAVHGGVYPVHLAMESFARFLIAMGYPEQRLRHPGDGRLSHSPYENSERLAGLVAWYYEKDGLRPMLVGHSQGGIQAVKVLYALAGRFGSQIPVWSPLTDRAESRFAIVDPLSGEEQPVVGLSVSYVAVVGAGGASLLLPNHWSMAGRMKTIPDTVDEFVGYSVGLDLVAWDLPGLAAASAYTANGTAKVRNVRLPAGYSHVVVPITAHLAQDAEMRERVNAYAPERPNGLEAMPDGAADNALWAADVWYGIKRHWCLEAQRLIRAQRAAIARGQIRIIGLEQGRD